MAKGWRGLILGVALFVAACQPETVMPMTDSVRVAIHGRYDDHVSNHDHGRRWASGHL